MALQGRALHFVFKIGDRAAAARFYRDILGMKVLRHEEFTEGCEAQCNGPYANRWSKTMIGYGPEDTHFVIELTYNYGIKSYNRGSDFLGLTIQSAEALKKAREANFSIDKRGDNYLVTAPDGYPFVLIDKPQPSDQDPVKKVTLASSDISRTVTYWNALLGLEKIKETSDSAEFIFSKNQASLEFIATKEKLDRGQAYGRIAFSIPTGQLNLVEKKVKDAGNTILTPLISLDTPGKATVSVVILADPDGHEICFVGDEGFRVLSQVDPNADSELNKFLKSDKS